MWNESGERLVWSPPTVVRYLTLPFLPAPSAGTFPSGTECRPPGKCRRDLTTTRVHRLRSKCRARLERKRRDKKEEARCCGRENQGKDCETNRNNQGVHMNKQALATRSEKVQCVFCFRTYFYPVGHACGSQKTGRHEHVTRWSSPSDTGAINS